MKLLDLTCPRCEKSFQRTVGSYNRSLNRQGVAYCSESCRRGSSQNKCENCGELTKNPRFCSRSCAGKRPNPKRRKSKPCPDCGSPIHIKRTRCKTCFIALKSAGKQYKYQSTHAKIRGAARQITGTRIQKCILCGYDKFVETCHVRSVSSFKEDDMLSVINDPSNLILLCPNCHWEFDHKMVTLERLELSVNSL